MDEARRGREARKRKRQGTGWMLLGGTKKLLLVVAGGVRGAATSLWLKVWASRASGTIRTSGD